MERFTLPPHLISTLSEIISEYSHANIDNLFMYANAPGEPPDGSKLTKTRLWLQRINTDENTDPLEVIGFLIKNFMAPPLPEPNRVFLNDNFFDEDFRDDEKPALTEQQEKTIEKIREALTRANLQYIPGVGISHISNSASRSLKEILEKHDYVAINLEFERALKNAESNPREAVSAACNILESLFKTYIEEEKLEMPAKQDLQPVWKVVRDDLGLNQSTIKDRDLQEILSGIFATVNGISALRTHASSAHGAGKNLYSLKPRHARLAVHSAHTLVTFVLESWQEKREKNPRR